MKAVVLENRDGIAAVLLEDGTVVKVSREYEVGSTIELTPDMLSEVPETKGKSIFTHAKKMRIFLAAAAAVLLLLTAGGVGYLTLVPYSTVTVEASEKIIYTLNRLDRVISVSSETDAGRKIAAALEKESIQNATLSDAIDKTMEAFYKNNIISEDSDVKVAAVSGSEQHAGKLAEDAQKAIDGYEENAVPPAAVTPGILPTESVPGGGGTQPGGGVADGDAGIPESPGAQNDDGDAGTAGNNGGTVDNNGGTVDNNGGTVDNNGGTVNNNGGTTGNDGGTTGGNGETTGGNGGTAGNNGGTTGGNGGTAGSNGGTAGNNGGTAGNNGGTAGSNAGITGGTAGNNGGTAGNNGGTGGTNGEKAVDNVGRTGSSGQ